jgi:hypothetical protein
VADSDSGSGSDSDRSDPPDPTGPPLTESARAVFEAARTLASALGGNFAALRRLLAADLALARAALIQALVLLFAVAILFGTAWVLLTVLAVYGMHAAGLGWGLAIVGPMLVSVVLGVFAIRRAIRMLQIADLDASRRQWTLWFGTFEEIVEAKQAPSGSLHAGAPPTTTTAETQP